MLASHKALLFLVLKDKCGRRSQVSLTFLAVGPIFIPMNFLLLDRNADVNCFHFRFGYDMRVVLYRNVNANSTEGRE